MHAMETESSSRKSSSGRSLKPVKVDMTPMVDLGFLLITFFIFNTIIGKPKCMDLIMPADGSPTLVAESRTLTILLAGQEKVFWYAGSLERDTRLQEVSMEPNRNSLRELVMGRQKVLKEGLETKPNMVVIIKPGEASTYREMIAALDEMTIDEIKRYTIVPQSAEEIKLMHDTEAGK